MKYGINEMLHYIPEKTNFKQIIQSLTFKLFQIQTHLFIVFFFMKPEIFQPYIECPQTLMHQNVHKKHCNSKSLSTYVNLV